MLDIRRVLSNFGLCLASAAPPLLFLLKHHRREGSAIQVQEARFAVISIDDE